MFDPRPELGRPDRGILSALTAEPALAPALSVVVRTDGLDAVTAEITRLQALQRGLEVERRTAGADVQADGFQLGPSDATRALNPGALPKLPSGCTVVVNADDSFSVRAASTGDEA